MTENVMVAHIWRIHNTHTHRCKIKRNYQIPAAAKCWIFGEKSTVHTTGADHISMNWYKCRLHLSMLSNSALREVDPHLSKKRGENNLFLYLQPEGENTSSKTLALKEYIHSLHRHRGKTWHLYLYQHAGLTLRLLSLIPQQMSHNTCIKELLKNHWGCT